MTVKKAITIMIASVVVFAAIGAALGAALGSLIPNYYRSIFLIAPDKEVSTVRIGMWLGSIQGLQAGLVVGLVLVLAMAWYRFRSAGRVPKQMKKTTKLGIALLAVVLLIASVPVGFFLLYAAASLGSNSGWTKLAAVWGHTLQKYQTPDEAAARIPDLIVTQLEDGQWVFGLTQGSHGVWNVGGGTIVVKDSRGDVRAFLGGHVCDPDWLPKAKSLDEFYEELKKRGFTEHHLQKSQAA